MKVFHGTSKQNALLINYNGIILNQDSMNIDNKGFSTFINAFFVTPNKDIAHIYECDNSKDGALIIEFELSDSSKILNLTVEEVQQKVIQYLENSNNTLNSYLMENQYDGCKQYHKNDYGKLRLEYAIINKGVLKISKVPKTKTKFMSLYSEALLPDINSADYL